MPEQSRQNHKRKIGARIRELRKTMRVSMNEFAELIDSTSATVSNLENGVSMPSGETLLRLAETLNVSVDWILLGRAGNEPIDANQDASSRLIFFSEKWHFFCRFQAGDMSETELLRVNDVVELLQSVGQCSDEELHMLLALAKKLSK